MTSISSIMRTAASGLTAQQLSIDAVANNIANVSTAGYKYTRIGVQDAEYISPEQSQTAQDVVGYEQMGTGVRVVATQRMFTQGPLQQTGNPLDLSITGEGFFQLRMPDGATAYTRGGQFGLDAEGKLVNAQGLYLATDVTVPPEATDLTITADGTVTTTVGEAGQTQTLGTLTLARFPNPAGLAAAGNGLFRATAASGAAAEGAAASGAYGEVQAGMLEGSNVEIATEMTGMVEAVRAYQLSVKMIQTIDEMMSMANTMRR